MSIKNFKDAIRDAGLIPPAHIPPGRIVAFPGMDKPPSNKAGRCFLFPDLKGGWFMDYSTGLYQVWMDSRHKPYTAAERAAFTKRCDEERAKAQLEIASKHAAGARKAGRLWNCATVITYQSDHAYLINKRIQPYYLRLLTDCLVIPLVDSNRQLVNLQFIDHQGAKRFLAGAKKKGCFAVIGDYSPANPILICEGWATGASLHDFSGHPVIIAMDAGNLTPVAEKIRSQYPEAEIIICGDNDVSGVGQKAARAAALACKGKYLIPSNPGHDWNDVLSGRVRHEGQ